MSSEREHQLDQQQQQQQQDQQQRQQRQEQQQQQQQEQQPQQLLHQASKQSSKTQPIMAHSSLSIDSLASNPRSSKFDITHRQEQLHFLQKALDDTEPPPPDMYADSVPTSIAIAGPGSYGVKEIDDNGDEIVLLNDDVLTSVANATVVIIDGNDLERITVLYQFPQFLEHCPTESINIMVPRICSEAVSWQAEAQVAATEALFYVVQVDVPHRIANHIACSALQITSECDDSHVFDACSELISTVLKQVHRYDVLQNVVPEAIDRAVSPYAPQRRLAARILGALNTSLSATELDTIFVKSALSLSSDTDKSVRAMTAQSLASMGRKVPLKVSERYLWPRLYDLINQDVVTVKVAAMRALAHSAEAHRVHNTNCKSYKHIMRPIFMSACEHAANVASMDLRSVSDDHYQMLEVFAEVFGHFLCALAPLLSSEQFWMAALNALRLMVTCNGPTVRHWCAFNMPAVATYIKLDRAATLSGVIPSLASDSDTETRSTLAAGIHELTRSLRSGPLRGDVIRAIGLLFMDQNAQVRMNALSHFSDLLILLSNPDDDDGGGAKDVDADGNKSKGTDKNPSVLTRMSDTNLDALHGGGKIKVADDVVIRYGGRMLAKEGTDEAEMRQLVPMFSSLELMSFDSWRTQRLLAEEVERSAHLIPQAMLCEHVAPLLFQMARESTFLVRKASMRSLVHVLRYVPDVRRRNHILKHFKAEWAKGKVYWTRLAFIDATECAFKVFSLRLFTALFKDEILSLRSDRVVNVRLRLLKFLRSVAAVWKPLAEFMSVVDDLCGDGDWQVSNEARELRGLLHSVDAPEPSAEDRTVDDAKEEAEQRFFKQLKHKRRKAKGRNSSKLRTSGGVGNATMANNNNTSTNATANGQPPLSAGDSGSRSRTQSGIFTTVDEIAELETKASHGHLSLEDHGSGSGGVHSGRIRTRSVIDSNGTYSRAAQQQQQDGSADANGGLALSASMSMALEDMFGPEGRGANGAGDDGVGLNDDLDEGGTPVSGANAVRRRSQQRKSGGSAVALAVAATSNAAGGGGGVADASAAAVGPKQRSTHNNSNATTTTNNNINNGRNSLGAHSSRSASSRNSALASESPSKAAADKRRAAEAAAAGVGAGVGEPVVVGSAMGAANANATTIATGGNATAAGGRSGGFWHNLCGCFGGAAGSGSAER